VQAYGSCARLLMKRDTAYGQAATGNYIRVPFSRCNLGSEQGMIDDRGLPHGDPLPLLQDIITNDVISSCQWTRAIWPVAHRFGEPYATDNLDPSWGS
jgi:hypothetical protein